MDPITTSLIAGGASAGIGALLGPKGPQGYSKGDIDYIVAQRSRQIDSFRNELAQARARLAARIPQLQTEAFNRFTPDLEAKLAARGLHVSGGAFASGAGKKGAELQAELEKMLYGAEREDITNVNNAYGQLTSAQLGGGFSNLEKPQGSPWATALGQFGGLATSAGLARLANTGSPESFASPSMFMKTSLRRTPVSLNLSGAAPGTSPY